MSITDIVDHLTVKAIELGPSYHDDAMLKGLMTGGLGLMAIGTGTAAYKSFKEGDKITALTMYVPLSVACAGGALWCAFA
ncbi:hypothetical protein JXB11_04180 [Candidatus Woesearchaeota archaeon]|nr:hypothetical protein [Candidatus Woesearchaeota archaeon]